MVLQEAELHVVLRVEGLLQVQRLGVPAQGDLPLQIVPVEGVDVVVVADVEGLIDLRVGEGGDALLPGGTDELRLHRLAEPEAPRPDGLHLRPGPEPEVQGHQGGHVAAEAVHHGGPVSQRLNLVVPEARVCVIQVDDIRPLADVVAEAAVGPVVEPLRVVLCQPGIRGGVVVHHVDDAPHPQAVDVLHQAAKVLDGAVVRVHRAVVGDGVGAAHGPLPLPASDGMDGHKPEDIRPQGADPLQIPVDGLKGPLPAVVADKDRVHNLIATGLRRISRHIVLPPKQMRNTPVLPLP